MLIIGIDPGAQGALVLLNPLSEGCKVMECRDMPAHDVTIAGKKRKQVDPHGLALVLRDWAPVATFAVLEHVSSMPKQGIASTFAFGRNAMAPEMGLATLNIPYNMVRPNVWKRVMQCPGDKDDARRRASQLLPNDVDWWQQKSHADRAEAALLALYGCRVYSAKSGNNDGGLLE